MKRFMPIAAVVALVLLATTSCDNFTQVTAEVPIDTQDQIKIAFDIGAMIKQQNPKFTVIDPVSGQPTEVTLSDLLKQNGGKLPKGIKETIAVPLPDFPLPTEVTNNPDIVQYKSKIYNVRIDTLEYTFNKNTLPSQIKLDKGLLIIQDSTGKEQVGVAFLPEITDSNTGTVSADFAPGGQDAASDLLAGLDFKMALLFVDGNGDFTKSKISITIDTDKDQSVPSGAFELVIRLKLVFRVAPLA